ncbi:MAG: 50S ribosomal protein L17 [Oligoflexia bacterium]|nr:50S ribosomal protein L17 [Oligoflexia bacterium]
MRHGTGYRKFQKSAAHTRAMLRNLATSLVVNENCETTVAKAKEVRRVVEKLITLAGTDSLASRRQAYSFLMNKGAVQKLFTDIAPRFKGRNGGYTRVIRSRSRHGDAAELAVVAFVEQKTATNKKEAAAS